MARDVYGKHFRELEGESYGHWMLVELIALALVESAELKPKGQRKK